LNALLTCGLLASAARFLASAAFCRYMSARSDMRLIRCPSRNVRHEQPVGHPLLEILEYARGSYRKPATDRCHRLLWAIMRRIALDYDRLAKLAEERLADQAKRGNWR
jgi:hypothetical protein